MPAARRRWLLARRRPVRFGDRARAPRSRRCCAFRAATPRRRLLLPRALFSHRAHASFGCYACHPSMFPQQTLVGFTHRR